MVDPLMEALATTPIFAHANRAIGKVQADADRLLGAYANLGRRRAKLFPSELPGYLAHQQCLADEIDTVLPIFDNEALRLTDENLRPRLIPFSLNGARFVVTIRWKSVIRRDELLITMSPTLPESIQEHYQAFVDRLCEEYKQAYPSEERVTVTSYAQSRLGDGELTEGRTTCTQFIGLMPRDARTRVTNALSFFGKERIYLITEPNGWIEGKSSAPISKQSLPVIVAGYRAGTLRIVCTFSPVRHDAIAHSKFTT